MSCRCPSAWSPESGPASKQFLVTLSAIVLLSVLTPWFPLPVFGWLP